MAEVGSRTLVRELNRDQNSMVLDVSASSMQKKVALGGGTDPMDARLL